jgi:hypothetical protein
MQNMGTFMYPFKSFPQLRNLTLRDADVGNTVGNLSEFHEQGLRMGGWRGVARPRRFRRE